MCISCTLWQLGLVWQHYSWSLQQNDDTFCLPNSVKYLLIAAYCASYNPASTDRRYFTKVCLSFKRSRTAFFVQRISRYWWFTGLYTLKMKQLLMRSALVKKKRESKRVHLISGIKMSCKNRLHDFAESWKATTESWLESCKRSSKCAWDGPKSFFSSKTAFSLPCFTRATQCTGPVCCGHQRAGIRTLKGPAHYGCGFLIPRDLVLKKVLQEILMC